MAVAKALGKKLGLIVIEDWTGELFERWIKGFDCSLSVKDRKLQF